MSTTIHVVGNLIPVPIIVDVENTARHILVNNDIEIDEGYDSCVEQLSDMWHNQYFISDKEIFMIDDVEDVEDYTDIFKGKRQDDGSISFEVKFYDGGCSFEEALGYAVSAA